MNRQPSPLIGVTGYTRGDGATRTVCSPLLDSVPAARDVQIPNGWASTPQGWVS